MSLVFLLACSATTAQPPPAEPPPFPPPPLPPGEAPAFPPPPLPPGDAPPVPPPPLVAELDPDTPAQGLDASWHQGEVDWAAVAAAGYSFVYLKATEGQDYTDPSFAAFWPAARQAGLLTGAYHFFRPEDTAESQAEFFLETVRDLRGALPAALDVELADGVAAADILAGVQRWIELVEAATGARPILYTGPKFWDSVSDHGLAGTPLWVAQYQVDSPQLPAGWQEWTFWQHTDQGTVAGITGDVDLSHFNGSHRELLALRIPPPPPPL